MGDEWLACFENVSTNIFSAIRGIEKVLAPGLLAITQSISGTTSYHGIYALGVQIRIPF